MKSLAALLAVVVALLMVPGRTMAGDTTLGRGAGVVEVGP